MDLMDAFLRSPASNIACLRCRKERFENNAESMDVEEGSDGILQDALMLSWY